jgi:hypothetical protein
VIRTRLLRVLLVASCCAVLGFAYARHRRAASRSQAPPWPDATPAHVPHVRGTITLDGDTDDSGWRGPTLRTGGFVGQDGVATVHPHSEARIVWGDGFLYMNLYAADEDIRATGSGPDSLAEGEDYFHLIFTDATTERVLDVNPLGFVTDGIRPRGTSQAPDRSWDSHTHVSHELDGTPNLPTDNDEEWVLEMAVPLESLGLSGKAGEQIGLSMHRCDTTHKGQRVCGSWGEVGRHKVLVLDAP